MVFTPTRGDGPLRFGPGVEQLNAVEAGVVPAEWYLDPERYEQERKHVLAPNWQIICRSSEVPNPGDFITWEGQGELIVVTRRKDGGLSGFHNVCQHRGAKIVLEDSGCARRFNCRWHNWTYDAEGTVVGIPDREDFRPEDIEGIAAPAVELDEWGGWVWAVLAGPGVAPPLTEWLGADITTDLGAYQMENMVLVAKATWDVPVNWKVIVDAFNENYHAPALHSFNTTLQDAKDGREATYFWFDPHAMMVVPYKGVLAELQEKLDHQGIAICHYTIFPTAVFNCNPRHLQLFRAVPTSVGTSRFECWELMYPGGDDEYNEKAQEHWGRLQKVVQEDVDEWADLDATKQSSAYKQNVLNVREGKIVAFHRAVQERLGLD